MANKLPQNKAGKSAATPHQGATPRPKHSAWWYLKIFFISLQLVVFCGIVISMAILRGIYDQLSRTVLPNTDFITERNKADKTVIYAADGKTVLAEFRGERRKYVSLDELKTSKTWKGKTVKVNRLGRRHAFHRRCALLYASRHGRQAHRESGLGQPDFRRRDFAGRFSTITEQLAVNLVSDAHQVDFAAPANRAAGAATGKALHQR